MADLSEVRFYIYFSDRENAQKAQASIVTDSAVTSEVRPAATGEDYLLLLSGNGLDINSYSRTLERLAKEFGGDFDGWEVGG